MAGFAGPPAVATATKPRSRAAHREVLICWVGVRGICHPSRLMSQLPVLADLGWHACKLLERPAAKPIGTALTHAPGARGMAQRPGGAAGLCIHRPHHRGHAPTREPDPNPARTCRRCGSVERLHSRLARAVAVGRGACFAWGALCRPAGRCAMIQTRRSSGIVLR